MAKGVRPVVASALLLVLVATGAKCGGGSGAGAGLPVQPKKAWIIQLDNPGMPEFWIGTDFPPVYRGQGVWQQVGWTRRPGRLPVWQLRQGRSLRWHFPAGESGP